MTIKELPVYPQIILSESQGLLGIRRWMLDADDSMWDFLRIVTDSHFPNYPDGRPIQIQSGAWSEGAKVDRNCTSNPRTYETMGNLPNYGGYLVEAQYALHRMTNCWPSAIPKPWHPPGTSLSLKIRGSGQFLLVAPSGVLATQAFQTCRDNSKALGLGSMATRILIPTPEYHVMCDRMTLAQVNFALGIPETSEVTGWATDNWVHRWDRLLGTVNYGAPTVETVPFLGAPEGTLLFDGYEITETFVCDVDNPYRYRMTACFKKRIIKGDDGQILDILDTTSGIQLPVGWNHDYVRVDDSNSCGWGWHETKLQHGCEEDEEGNKKPRCLPRYGMSYFENMYGVYPDAEPTICGEEDTTATSLTDGAVCINNPFPSESPEEEPDDDTTWEDSEDYLSAVEVWGSSGQ